MNYIKCHYCEDCEKFKSQTGRWIYKCKAILCKKVKIISKEVY